MNIGEKISGYSRDQQDYEISEVLKSQQLDAESKVIHFYILKLYVGQMLLIRWNKHLHKCSIFSLICMAVHVKK